MPLIVEIFLERWDGDIEKEEQFELAIRKREFYDIELGDTILDLVADELDLDHKEWRVDGHIGWR